MRSCSRSGSPRLRNVVVALAAGLATADATLLADLNPALPKAAVTDIGQFNYEPCPKQFPDCKGFVDPGTAKVFYVNQSRYVFDKPAHFDRAEVHGLKNHALVENQQYFLGWDFAVSDFPRTVSCTGLDSACTVQSNRIFQLHTYGDPNTLDIPLQVYFNPTAPGASASATVFGIIHDKNNARVQITLFSTPPLVTGTVYPIILAFKTSRSPTGGTVQVWWGGKLQTLKTGGTIYKLQTWDGTNVAPKWGAYGAWSTALKTTVGRIRLGTTLADVLR